MRRTIHLYSRFVAAAIRARMQYRADFLISFAGILVLNIVNLSLLWVIVSRFKDLAGWTYWELSLLYGTWLVSHCINAIFFWHLPRLEDDIRFGRFDQFLLRPCSPLAQYLGRDVNYYGVSDMVIAIGLVSLSMIQLHLNWGPVQWALFGVMVLAGFVLEMAISLTIGAIAFWTTRSRALFGVTSRFNTLVQNYPIDAFGQWFRLFVTGLVPVAFISYYPLTLLLGKQNAFGIPELGYLSPLVAAVVLLIALRVWKAGIAIYTGSGS